jgi:hypothetical protein
MKNLKELLNLIPAGNCGSIDLCAGEEFYFVSDLKKVGLVHSERCVQNVQNTHCNLRFRRWAGSVYVEYFDSVIETNGTLSGHITEYRIPSSGGSYTGV